MTHIINPLIYDLTLQDIQIMMDQLHEPVFRASQVWEGLYHQYFSKSNEFTNIPSSLRIKLAEMVDFSHLNSVEILVSKDHKTQKNLFQLPDSNLLETVLMGYEKRKSICISSQVGCAMGCIFCATGQLGFKRNLSSGEMVEQVLYFARELKKEGQHLTNVVVMGMGEPFINYEATIKAINFLNNPTGFNFGERRFTISTVGIIPAIDKFAAEKRQINLAVSLHAANNELRTKLIPVNKIYPLDDLIISCQNYTKITRRRITFEWALIQDTNDSLKDARELSQLLKGMLCHVNLILLNPTTKYSGKGATNQRANAFQQELNHNGIPCTMRLRRGIEIHAGCGQLAGKELL